MFSSFIDDHMFQEVPRNSCQLQSTPQTRPRLSIPNSSALPSGILDMSFNRRSLDWSELQLFAPHSSFGRQQTTFPSTDTQSTGDIHSQLSQWNFPSRPSVSPRLVLWGPFNKIEQYPSEQLGFPPQTSPSTASHLLTPPPHGTKAAKRGRHGYLSSACPSMLTPPMPTKRPRTAEKDAYEFPPPPRYTTCQISAYPTPSTSPTSQSTGFYDNHPMAEESLNISPFSSSFASFPPAMSVDSKGSYCQCPTPEHSDFPHAQLSHSSSSTSNYGYYPNSPVSPTTALSSSPFSSNSSNYSSPPASRCYPLNFHNPQHSDVWSLEWHQTFNQFRYQNC
ncbi:hypothetical protein PtA15_13A155 [Puccinia triticina]|uniref:Uncharacterized protein n=1 Tax=Puccinia triticina TaxID=208348 RepID=A0ABY7CZK4_9BASI|nr:uncharacterized protein PtA15_13A155 [Puccinia triticina]WAQ90756.1 hypothetical protein PtA15_13A155 [Puccinia triticina]WAR60940.1 hypothetical protein PtB15_13B191 [Puccinia triticina]